MLISNPFNPPSPQGQNNISWVNLHGSSLSVALSSLILQNNRPVLIVTPDSQSAFRLEQELAFFNPTGTLIQFPDWETLPYDQFSPHEDIISNRIYALNSIPRMQNGTIITPISTLMHRLPPKTFFNSHLFLLKVGDIFNITKMREILQNAGYNAVNEVRTHGEFAIRGAIMDIFPMGSELPFRIDLLDNEVDSIRTFSKDTQRSLEKIDKIELLPAKEFPLNDHDIERFREQWRINFSGNPMNCPVYQDISEGICSPGIEYYLPFFFDKTATLFDFLPDNTLLVLLQDIHPKAEEFWQEIKTRYEQRRHDQLHPLVSPEKMFIPTQDIFNAFNNYSRIKIEKNLSKKNTQVFSFVTKEPLLLPVEHKAKNPLATLENFIHSFTGRLLFCAETMGRREVLLQLFHTISLRPTFFPTWDAFLQDNARFGITVAPLDEGCILEEPSIALIAETQLFGKRIMQRRLRKNTQHDLERQVKDLAELQVGAPIVHIDHGVGRYLGLQTLAIGEQLTEFLCLEYADEAKLYVPISSLHLISRYSGSEPEHAPLHRLGTEQWQRIKRKAATQIRDIAAELLDLYAKREAEQGFAFQMIEDAYATFAAAFPFEETEDQLKAINEVIQDMMAEKPMDRLVCGDVGFGKTEVAMRAAFFATLNQKQTAVLVPTTLLAEQHFQTFQNRFADWPIKIAVMSRFQTQKERLQITEQLASGKIDIVIGTHRLLQENIKFNALGLIIIDEEHRFGVQQKEQLKSMRVNVDILTLTATPIPRTLNMAFAGMRDLSLITTPPAKRLSIKTFVHEYQASIVQEGILREILRGGQVYFLHNEISTIEKTTRDLEKLIPEGRIGIAHGQMREQELEQVMIDFYHRRFNILVCTTIIESGIDIPSANTIIINRADKFGLAELHQLRGRVGRSHHQAYAYLFIPSRKTLTPDATKRLDAIAAHDNLGIGFTLATFDLEIRGAGELLGKNQSGQMQEMGFSLYMEMLNRAVTALKSGQPIDLEKTNTKGTEIDLQIPVFIPDHYLGDVHLRLQCYKRIASAKTVEDLDEIQVEMIDRFGLLPEPLKNIFAITALKQMIEPLGIIKLEANSTRGLIEFNEKPLVDPLRIIQLIQTQSHYFKLEGPTKLRFKLDPHQPSERIQLVEKILKKLIEKKI